MLDKIRQIVADITQNDLASVTTKSNSQNLGGWDSVAQINIVVTIEQEFGVTFSAEEMHTLNSVEKIASALSATPTPR
jgi:acyl carrier protein